MIWIILVIAWLLQFVIAYKLLRKEFKEMYTYYSMGDRWLNTFLCSFAGWFILIVWIIGKLRTQSFWDKPAKW